MILPLLLNSDIKIVIPGIDGPNLNLLNQLKDFEFILASEQMDMVGKLKSIN